MVLYCYEFLDTLAIKKFISFTDTVVATEWWDDWSFVHRRTSGNWRIPEDWMPRSWTQRACGKPVIYFFKWERKTFSSLLWSSLFMSRRHAVSISGLRLSSTCRHHLSAESFSTRGCFLWGSYNLWRRRQEIPWQPKTKGFKENIEKHLMKTTSSRHPAHHPLYQGSPPNPKLTL